MKLSEIDIQLNEDTGMEEDFNVDLENILYAGYANKLKKISTKAVAKQMINMGYQTSLTHIADVAQTIPIVSNASVSVINLGEDVVDDMTDDSEDTDSEQEEHVSDMAQDEAMDNIEN